MLGRQSFLKHLGVNRMQGSRGVWELAWEGDARCTWEYGDPQSPGKCHIIWRRAGLHAIYDDP